MPPLRFTGERLIPEDADPQLLAEHVACYRFAARAAGAAAGRVLDLGCGTGYGSAILAAGGARGVVGVDRSPSAIAHAAAQHPGRYVIADAGALPFADAAFDLVVALELIEHLVRPEVLVGEMRRVLAADGTAIVSTP